MAGVEDADHAMVTDCWALVDAVVVAAVAVAAVFLV